MWIIRSNTVVGINLKNHGFYHTAMPAVKGLSHLAIYSPCWIKNCKFLNLQNRKYHSIPLTLPIPKFRGTSISTQQLNLAQTWGILTLASVVLGTCAQAAHGLKIPSPLISTDEVLWGIFFFFCLSALFVQHSIPVNLVISATIYIFLPLANVSGWTLKKNNIS